MLNAHTLRVADRKTNSIVALPSGTRLLDPHRPDSASLLCPAGCALDAANQYSPHRASPRSTGAGSLAPSASAAALPRRPLRHDGAGEKRRRPRAPRHGTHVAQVVFLRDLVISNRCLT